MTNGVPHCFLDVLQYHEICFVVTNKKLQMKIDCGGTTKDSVKLGDTFLNGTIALA